MNDHEYNTDIVKWSDHQAALLRRVAAGEMLNDSVDWEKIIEEIEEAGNSKRDTLERRIGTAVEHLIKLQASPATNPRNKWKMTILRCRRDIARILGKPTDNLSLRNELPDIVHAETLTAHEDAAKALEIFREIPLVDIDALTYTPEQVCGDWFPPEEKP